MSNLSVGETWENVLTGHADVKEVSTFRDVAVTTCSNLKEATEKNGD